MNQWNAKTKIRIKQLGSMNCQSPNMSQVKGIMKGSAKDMNRMSEVIDENATKLLEHFKTALENAIEMNNYIDPASEQNIKEENRKALTELIKAQISAKDLTIQGKQAFLDIPNMEKSQIAAKKRLVDSYSKLITVYDECITKATELLKASNMPTLTWIGKEKVVNHHQEVPYRVLEHKYGFRADDSADMTPTNSGNKIIHGDNLEALKSLLPKYEGRIKCIYIDPPYNTGNEKWIYNDNVNDPKIKKWLGEVVGKQGEDLSRHDKWLCMMYPRLKLLHKLLADDGVIFISIDDNEEKYLHLIMDEIFGNRCFIHKIIWKNKYGPGALTKGVGNVHEYIICYSKNPIESVAAPLSEEEIKKYKLKDEKYSIRGGYIR